MSRPGWYEDPDGTKRWWSRETGWTNDVQSPSGMPRIDFGPTPSGPPMGLPESDTSSPLSWRARTALEDAEPADPFPLVGGGCGGFAILFVLTAVITQHLGLIFLVTALGALVVGLVCSKLLRDPAADVRRHALVLLVFGYLLVMAGVGLIGIGFGLAARSTPDPDRARRHVRRGWRWMGIVGTSLFLGMAVLAFLDNSGLLEASR